MSGVEICMRPLEGHTVGQGEILEFMSRLDKTTQLCTEGEIQRTFSCLHDLYNKCARHKGSSHKVDLLVNVGKWREAMNNICDNLEYFKDNADCEKKASVEYIPCAEAAMAMANEKYSVVNNPKHVSEHQRMNETLRIGCTVAATILDCLKKPFKKFCPDQLTNLLVNTVESFRPPACAKRSVTYANHEHANRVDISISTSEIKSHTGGNSRPTGENHGPREAVKSSRSANRFESNTSPILTAYSWTPFVGLFIVSLFVRI